MSSREIEHDQNFMITLTQTQNLSEYLSVPSGQVHLTKFPAFSAVFVGNELTG